MTAKPQAKHTARARIPCEVLETGNAFSHLARNSLKMSPAHVQAAQARASEGVLGITSVHVPFKRAAAGQSVSACKGHRLCIAQPSCWRTIFFDQWLGQISARCDVTMHRVQFQIFPHGKIWDSVAHDEKYRGLTIRCYSLPEDLDAEEDDQEHGLFTILLAAGTYPACQISRRSVWQPYSSQVRGRGPCRSRAKGEHVFAKETLRLLVMLVKLEPS